MQVPARVFTEPFAEWAQLLSEVTGWDVDDDELHETARRIVLAKRAFNLREGWTPADDWLPERFLDSPLEPGSGRTATLPAARLRTMIDTTTPNAAWTRRAGRSPRRLAQTAAGTEQTR